MDELEKYYQYLKSNGADVPSNYNSFRTTLSDSATANQYYNYLKQNQFDVPDNFDSFRKTFNIGYDSQEVKQQKQPAIPGFMDIGSQTQQTIQTAQQNIPKVQQQPITKPKQETGVFDASVIGQEVKPTAPVNKGGLPIGVAVGKDKKKEGSTLGGIYNTLVGSLARFGGGVAQLGTDLVNLKTGIPYIPGVGLQPIYDSEQNRAATEGFIEKARTVKSTKQQEQARSQFDLTDGISASDVEALAFQAPSQLLDLTLGALTYGSSFFIQAVNDNAKELEQNTNADKLGEGGKLAYVYVQAIGQSALEKFGLDRILKGTGLNKAVTKKIANEITDELVAKGGKATAKQVQDLAIKKASQLSSKIKKVGLGAALGFGVEGATEGAQEAANKGIKLLTNKLASNEVFDEQDIIANFKKDVINSAAAGGVFGSAFGGGAASLSNTNKSIRRQIAQANKPEDLQKIADDVNAQIQQGTLTPQEGEQALTKAQEYTEIASTIPAEIDEETKYDVIGGIEQRKQLEADIQKLQQELQSVDPAFAKQKQDQLDLLKDKLGEVNDYIQVLVTGEKPKYVERNGKYFKIDPATEEETEITKGHYELANAADLNIDNPQKRGEPEEITQPIELKVETPQVETPIPVTEQQPAVSTETTVTEVEQPITPTTTETLPLSESVETEQPTTTTTISESEVKPVGGEEIVSYEDAVKITPTSEITDLEQYGTDELGREMKTASIRDQEKTPPTFKKYPINTYAKDRFGDLYQLQEIPIENIVLPEGENKRRETVEKYKQWNKQGNEFPPAKGVENFAEYGGKIVINDGHHRVVAAKELGAKKVAVWVSLTDPKNPARPIQDIQYHKSLLKGGEETITEQVTPQPTIPITEPTTTTPTTISKEESGAKDLGTKARELAAKVRSGEKQVLPDWLQANLPKGTQKQGIGINEAFAKALETFADIYDTTKDFAQAVEQGFKNIKDWFDENKIPYNEAELKSQFAKDRQAATEETQTPPTPPIPPVSEGGNGEPPTEPPPIPTEAESNKFDDKGILNRLFESGKIKDTAKARFEKEGLKYQTASQQEARNNAKDIIDALGYGEAILLAEAGKFNGDVNSMIFAESIDQIAGKELATTDPTEAAKYGAQWAEYSIRYDELARDKGRFISAIYDFYKKSPLGVVIKENRNREGIFNDWFKGKEVDYKALFDEIKKSEKGTEALKTEGRKVLREERRQKIEDFFESAKFKGDALYATPIPPKVINGAIELMKKTFLAGESVVYAVEVAIEHISAQVQNWDKEKFRKEWERKLNKIDSSSIKGEKTLEEKQREYLERFKKRLDGMNDEQKEQVIQKSIRKLIESGALEYEDFKKIIAETLGIGQLTPEQAARMKELSKRINAMQDAAKEAMTKRTPEGIKEFEKKLLQAEEAAHELDNMVYVKAAPVSRFMDVVKLNTLGIVSLVKNVSYNAWFQPILFTKGLFKTGFDYSIYGLSQLSNKAFGTKIIQPDTNIFLAQKDYFKGAREGLKRSLYQVKTGLQDRDYFSREVKISQIRPRHAWKDIWAWKKGEKFLTKEQFWDKLIQGTGGVNAEIIARLLNVGDKWQKFGAERAEAAQVASMQLGIEKAIDKELFVKFPKEEAYRIYKQKGLSDEEATAKAEEVEKRIVNAGEKAITQQSNWLNDQLSALDKWSEKKGEDDPIYKLAGAVGKIGKGLTMPFVKIPLNVAWNVINFVTPELAIGQSAFYGYQALKYKNAGDMVKARENYRRSKDWLAHAATGMALLAASQLLVSMGAIRGRNDFEEDEPRETKGETNYGRQYSINLSMIRRLATGGDTRELPDDIWVDLSWFGIAGGIMNIQAVRMEEKMQAKEQEDKTYFDDLVSRMKNSAAEGLDNGVFSGTNSLMNAYKQGGGYVDSWLLGMANLGMNFFEPATYAQFSRAAQDEKTVYKAETGWQEFVNNQKQRDVLFRQLAGKAPSDITIWGEPAKKQSGSMGIVYDMFGIQKGDTSKFGVLLYLDYARTKNAKFFPPYVDGNISVDGKDVKLPLEQARDLKSMVGRMRKTMVEPLIMGSAMYKGKKYGELSDTEKLEALDAIYRNSTDIAMQDFRNKYPEYKNTESREEERQKEKAEQAKEKLLRNVAPKK